MLAGLHVHVCVTYMYIEHVFVGCCLATRGVKGLLWANGWVWLLVSGVARQHPTNLLHHLIGGACSSYIT